MMFSCRHFLTMEGVTQSNADYASRKGLTFSLIHVLSHYNC
jgi:hypothetical protein